MLTDKLPMPDADVTTLCEKLIALGFRKAGGRLKMVLNEDKIESAQQGYELVLKKMKQIVNARE